MMSFCFCTLAIHEPYRRRARLLCADLAPAPVVVATDVPEDFADLPVRIVPCLPGGPMAIDYLRRPDPDKPGPINGAGAYHDKRFAVREALRHFDTAIYLDADSRIPDMPPFPDLRPGLSLLPVCNRTIREHLALFGAGRTPAFEALAVELRGTTDVLEEARWCYEAFYAITKDGHEDRFFEAWDRGAAWMQRSGVFSGEGGVMGLAAQFAGWAVDYERLAPLEAHIHHEGGGPKGE